MNMISKEGAFNRKREIPVRGRKPEAFGDVLPAEAGIEKEKSP